VKGAVAAAILVGALAACSEAKDHERRRQLRSDAPLSERLVTANTAAGASIFRQCAACHPMAAGAGDRNGPNLYGVVGKPIASISRRFGYTAALRDLGGTWTPERLDAWLKDPQQFAPGTRMATAGLSNGVDRADVIAFLQENRRN
jgi:cytochrome c